MIIRTRVSVITVESENLNLKEETKFVDFALDFSMIESMWDEEGYTKIFTSGNDYVIEMSFEEAYNNWLQSKRPFGGRN